MKNIRLALEPDELVRHECTLEELLEANDGLHPDEIQKLKNLSVGEDMTIGGGAFATVIVRRLPDEEDPESDQWDMEKADYLDEVVRKIRKDPLKIYYALVECGAFLDNLETEKIVHPRRMDRMRTIIKEAIK